MQASNWSKPGSKQLIKRWYFSYSYHIDYKSNPQHLNNWAVLKSYNSVIREMSWQDTSLSSSRNKAPLLITCQHLGQIWKKYDFSKTFLKNGRRGLEICLPLGFGRSGQLSQNKFFDPSTPSSFWWVTILGLVGDHPRVCGWPSSGLWSTESGKGPTGSGKGVYQCLQF